MTRITVTEGPDGMIRGIESRGHAGAGRNGEIDLVCCAISTLLETGANALERVAGVVPAEEVVRDGYLLFRLPESLSPQEEQTCQIILRTVLSGLTDIEETYPKFIRIEKRNGGKAND